MTWMTSTSCRRHPGHGHHLSRSKRVIVRAVRACARITLDLSSCCQHARSAAAIAFMLIFARSVRVYIMVIFRNTISLESTDVQSEHFLHWSRRKTLVPRGNTVIKRLSTRKLFPHCTAQVRRSTLCFPTLDYTISKTQPTTTCRRTATPRIQPNHPESPSPSFAGTWTRGAPGPSSAR